MGQGPWNVKVCLYQCGLRKFVSMPLTGEQKVTSVPAQLSPGSRLSRKHRFKCSCEVRASTSSTSSQLTRGRRCPLECDRTHPTWGKDSKAEGWVPAWQLILTVNLTGLRSPRDTSVRVSVKGVPESEMRRPHLGWAGVSEWIPRKKWSEHPRSREGFYPWTLSPPERT